MTDQATWVLVDELLPGWETDEDDPLRYFIEREAVLWLKGTVRPAAGSGADLSAPVFVLPEGCRPPRDHSDLVGFRSADAIEVHRTRVDADGTVYAPEVVVERFEP